MAETTWAEESPSAPPKKKIPTWVWFCGAGCLAMLVLGIGAAVLVMGFVKNARDPEKQWEEIAKVLPYDQRPPEMTPEWGGKIGIEQYVLRDERGYEIQIQHLNGQQASETREKMFMKEKPEFPKNLVVLKFGDVKPGTIDVQGRQVHVLRTTMELQGFMKRVVPKEGQGQFGDILFADVTPEGRDDLVLLQLSRLKVNQDNHGEGPISDEEVQAVLKPFRVGPKR